MAFANNSNIDVEKVSIVVRCRFENQCRREDESDSMITKPSSKLHSSGTHSPKPCVHKAISGKQSKHADCQREEGHTECD
eukprot:4662073-Amphidinium_carterae.1